MEETILRSDAMKIIDSGQLINIAFVTADRRRGTGGKYIELKQWAKVKETPNTDAHPGQLATPRRDLIKDPNHGLHKTFNICNPQNPAVHIHKVHYRLIHMLNGKRVVQ